MSKAKQLTRGVEDADEAVAKAVEPYASTPFVRTIAVLSEIGDQPQMRTLCGLVIAAGLLNGSSRLTRAGVHMLLAHSVATEAKNLIKHNVDRTRPRSRSGRDAHRIKSGKDHAKEETSFPSGHTAGAVAVARAFGRHYPEHQAAALTAAGLVALAQIPRCAHYPSDVGVGMAIGIASEAAVAAVAPDFGS